MDIQKQIAMQAVLKAHKRNGTKPPPELLMVGGAPAIKKAPVQTGADSKQISQAKNAAAAAIAARLGGGSRPPPQTAAGGGGPSDEALDKFRKMVKMGVPPPAIRGKMAAEGISSIMIEEVLSGGSAGRSSGAVSRPTATILSSGVGGNATKLSLDEESIASQYRKMVKIGLPQGAIIHKMTSDGVPKHIQNSVFAGEETGSSTGASRPAASSVGSTGRGGPVSTLSPADEQVAAQYRKMMKFGLPEGAIIHKMNGDGIPQHIQQSVLRNESPGPTGGDGGAGGEPTSGGGGPSSRLSSEEEAIAAPYRRMVKMSLPDGAILHKMGMDGIAQNIQNSVIAREVPRVAITTPTSSGGLGIGASAFSAGAASLKKATPQKSKSSPSPSSSSNGKRGSPLAMAAAAAAALRGKGLQKMRNVPQNPVPQKNMSAGPEAMAQAAAAAAARRALRQQDANTLQQFESRSIPQKVSSQPMQMVALKSRNPASASAPLLARTAAPTSSLKKPVPTTTPPVSKPATSVSAAPKKPTPASTPILQKRVSPIANQPHVAPPAPVQRIPKPTATPSSRKSEIEVRKPAAEVRKPSTEVQKPTPEVQKPTPYISTPMTATTSTQNSVSASLAVTVPTEAPVSPPAPDAVIGLDPDEEEVAEHYRNLIREYGQSLDTVKEEMVNDGAPANIQEAVIAAFVAGQSVDTEVVPTADEQVVVLDEDVDQQIDALEEEVAEHYRTLVRNGQSLDEVIKEMIADGAPQQIQDAVTSSSFVHTLAPEACANTTVDTSSMSDPETEAHDVYVTAPPPSSYRSARDIAQDAGTILLEDPTVQRSKETPKIVPRKEESKAAPRKEDPMEHRKDEQAQKVVPKSTVLAVPNKDKKKPRKKTAKGTTILNDGAEQHCACTVM